MRTAAGRGWAFDVGLGGIQLPSIFRTKCALTSSAIQAQLCWRDLPGRETAWVTLLPEERSSARPPHSTLPMTSTFHGTNFGLPPLMLAAVCDQAPSDFKIYTPPVPSAL